MKTTVVNLYKNQFDVYVGRPRPGWPSIFGNPSRLTAEKDREQAVAEYRVYFYNRLESDPEFKTKVLALKGKKLGCFCRPDKGFRGKLLCHAQVIAGYIEGVDPRSIP